MMMIGHWAWAMGVGGSAILKMGAYKKKRMQLILEVLFVTKLLYSIQSSSILHHPTLCDVIN
jgi:Na+/glutamate symporter